MNHIDFRRIDLNLLVTFDALMLERSVTRAAERLGVGQSAVSHSLARLRGLLRDRLFVATKRGLVPTSRAEQFTVWTRSFLEEAQRKLLDHASFDPAEWSGTVRLAMTPTVDMALMPRLLARLTKCAPRVRVNVYAVEEWNGILDGLNTGAIDLYLGVTREIRPYHRHRSLWSETLLAVFSPIQVKARTPLSLVDYLAHSHLRATTREANMEDRIDQALSQLKRKREIVLSTPHFIAFPHLLSAAPLIATLQGRPARWLASAFKLKTSPLPLKIEFAESMVWHEAVDRDPALAWLRETILELAGQKLTATGPS